MPRKSILTGVLALCLGACGGSTDGDDGSAGGSGGSGGSAASGGTGGSGGSGASSGSGGGSVGGSGGMPAECAVPSSAPGPYAVKFRFTNSSPSPLYVLGECHLRYEVKSCADDYQKPLSLWGDCTIDCMSPDARNGGCIACGACMYQGLEVTNGAPVESEWSGNTFQFSQTPSGCSCHDKIVAPAGKYRIEVPVYASDEQNGSPIYTVPLGFELPAPNGVVEVPLAVVGGSPAP